MDTELTFSESPEDPFGLTRSASAVLDGRGKIVGWSPMAEKLLGYRPQEVIGRQALDVLIAADDQETVLEVAAEAARGVVCFAVLPVRRGDGHRVRLGIRARLVDRAGSVGEWLLVGAPAAGVVRWETDRSVLDGLFSRCPIGISVHAPDLSIIRVNRAIALIGGIPVELLSGLRIGDFLVAEDTETVERRLRGVLETGRPLIFTEQPCRLLSNPGQERFVAVSAFRMEDPSGRVLGVTQLVEDVTDRHRAQRRLALLNQASAHIGTTLDLAKTARELAEAAVPELADLVSVDLLEPVIRGEDLAPDERGPLRRLALRSVAPEATPMMHPENDEVFFTSYAPQAQSLIERRPILQAVVKVDTSWFLPGDERARHIDSSHIHSLMALPLTARGVVLGLVSMWRARRPEPFEEADLTLAGEFAARAAVAIDNARQYTQQHEAAVTLQRSLLPAVVPEHPAVEIAHRYLPADVATGVGGDWFDVIPLSGVRVALVVGDVVGHGLPAAATMGRLRTAVHTLAALDLEPEEVVSQLDELVARLSEERKDLGELSSIDEFIGVTCLYAVYDPTTKRCVVARAGHPPPAVLTPDGDVGLLDVPASPPLGLGGLPFESVEVELAEGSLLALYTDGLIEAGRRDIDEGVRRLCTALAQPAQRLDDVCSAVMETVRDARPTDDVALLLARTRALPADRIAAWELPAEPTSALRARELTEEQLSVWGLGEMAFTTELIVSELVTNAYRYAGGPVELRLIRDHTLICEVSDPSTTAPHLRHARSTDEGGRGLFLVAQLTEHWGTRFTSHGKTVWTEQLLDGAHLL